MEVSSLPSSNSPEETPPPQCDSGEMQNELALHADIDTGLVSPAQHVASNAAFANTPSAGHQSSVDASYLHSYAPRQLPHHEQQTSLHQLQQQEQIIQQHLHQLQQMQTLQMSVQPQQQPLQQQGSEDNTGWPSSTPASMPLLQQAWHEYQQWSSAPIFMPFSAMASSSRPKQQQSHIALQNYDDSSSVNMIMHDVAPAQMTSHYAAPSSSSAMLFTTNTGNPFTQHPPYDKFQQSNESGESDASSMTTTALSTLLGGLEGSRSSSTSIKDKSTSQTSTSSSSKKQCSTCGQYDTPEWRRGKDRRKTLCNACGLRYARSAALAAKSRTGLARTSSVDAYEHAKDETATSMQQSMPTQIQDHIEANRSTSGGTALRTSAWAVDKVRDEDRLDDSHAQGGLDPASALYAGLYLTDGDHPLIVDDDDPRHTDAESVTDEDGDGNGDDSEPASPSSSTTQQRARRRFQCPFAGCEKTYSTSGHAARHSRVHESLHPFVCPHPGCESTFTRRDNCTQHQRRRHDFQLAASRS